MKCMKTNTMNMGRESLGPSRSRRQSGILKTTVTFNPVDSYLKQFEVVKEELSSYAGDDPLSVWCKCIQWLEQNVPKKERKGHLEDLMQQCLSTLRDRTQYFNDKRFIEIWLKFARTTESPLEIYNYMYSRKIGCKSASLFIAWSWHLEQEGDIEEAHKVLKEGVYLESEPFEEIKSYRSEFKRRILSKIMVGSEEGNYKREISSARFSMPKPQNRSSLSPTNKSDPQSFDSNKVSMKTDFQLPLQDYYSYSNRLSSMRSCTSLGNALHSNENSMPSPKDTNTSSESLRSINPPVALFEPPDPMKTAMYDKNKVYGASEELSLEEIRAAAWFKRKKAIENEKKVAEQEKLLAQQNDMIRKLQQEIELLKNERTSFKPVMTPSREISGSQKLPDISNQVSANGRKNCDPSLLTALFPEKVTDSNKVVDMVKEMYNNTLLKPKDTQNLNVNENSRAQFNKVISDQAYIPFSNPTEEYPCLIDNNPKESFASAVLRDPAQLQSNVQNSCVLQQCLTSRNISYPNKGSENVSSKSNLQGDDLCEYASLNSDDIKDKSFSSEEKYLHKNSNPTLQDETILPPFSEQFSCAPFLASTPCVQSNFNASTTRDQNYYLSKSIYSGNNYNTGQLSVILETSKECYKSSSSSGSSGNATRFSQFYSQDKSSIYKHLDKTDLTFKEPKTLNQITDISTNSFEKEDAEFNDISKEDIFELDSVDIVAKDNISEHLDKTYGTAKEPKLLNHNTDILTNIFEKEDAESKDLSDKVMFEKGLTDIASKSEHLKKTDVTMKESKSLNQKEDSSKERRNAKKPATLIAPNNNVFNEIDKISVVEKPKALEANSKSLTNIIDKENVKISSSIIPKSNIPKYVDKTRAILKETKQLGQNTNSLNSDIGHEIVKSKCFSEKETFKIHSTDIDPFDEKLNQDRLEALDLPPDYYGNIKTSQTHIRNFVEGNPLEIGNTTYIIENLVAAGSYGKVFAAINKDSNSKAALKICKCDSNWELYICTTLHQRLKDNKMFPNVSMSVMKINSAHRYSKTLILATEFSQRGTLVDLVNFYQKQNSAIPELVSMYLTLEMLQIMSKIHECKIVHADMKPDNVLLRDNVSDVDILDSISQKTMLLKLIDFGRSIDLKLFKNGICFTVALKKEKCIEMRLNKPWVFQLDWYGLLNCVHILLFSEYMKVRQNARGRWEIEKKFKRYWDQTIWAPLFDELLNIPSCYQEPDIEKHANRIKSKLQQSEKDFKIHLKHFMKSYTRKIV